MSGGRGRAVELPDVKKKKRKKTKVFDFMIR